MTFSSKLCISLVALALATGGASAATTVNSSRSNSSDRAAAAADFDKSNITDKSTGCTNGQSGGTMGSLGRDDRRLAQGSSTGGDGRSEVKDSHDRYNMDSPGSVAPSETTTKTCDKPEGHKVLIQRGRVQ